ncbi:MAG: hypothetical protein JWP88_89 [Flaviaesturariibacter sp.]|nr:hypothetical protein [Flaviaesturariibacter sp.]
MYKRLLIAAVLLCGATAASAQTLFTYGNQTVTVPEFLKAYRKNNNAAGKQGNAGLNDYLDLYITSRLKVAEAKALGYDTLPQMVTDLQNLRAQIIPTYLNDDAATNRLIAEAFTRQQKDIHIAHLFIASKTDAEVAAGNKKMAEAISKLQKGVAFATIAKDYSDDPSAKTNGGDLGFITAFSLPYELENLAYNTPAGQLSKVYRSRAGLHLFKNLGVRKDIGRIKAAQILVAFPPEATAADKAAAKKLVDSLFNRLAKGDDFSKLATQFSNDVVSAASGGVLTEFGTGQYDPVFEQQTFALAKDGAWSKPFQTAFGWHIVKRISRTAVPTVRSEATLAALRERVETSDRINTAKDELAKKVLAQLGYQKSTYPETVLWSYADSVLEGKSPAAPTGITENTAVATIGGQKLSAADWTTYARSFRFKSDGSGLKTYSQVWDEFIPKMALDYYKDNLERYNPDFKAQVEEFKEGNLFFEIMQRKVWGPAQADTAALEAYYNRHREKYNWKPSADAVIFYASDSPTAKAAIAALTKAPATWKEISTAYEDKLAADSNRFELDAIPNPTKLALKAGTITSALVNASDNTASFAYILRLHPTVSPRSFAEAKGLVINDYQTELESNWVNTLRAKYPVTINQQELLKLVK